MNKAIFYHAGCPVCQEAETKITQLIDRSKYDLEIVSLGEDKQRITEAARVGIRSVPAILIDGTPLHLNHGADLQDLK